jgi:AraC-like DNA-binding protein
VPNDTNDAERVGQRLMAPELFERNRQRRDRLAEQASDAREELVGLLVWGTSYGFDVAHMARMAGISRETAHKLFRQAGEFTLHQQIVRREQSERQR